MNNQNDYLTHCCLKIYTSHFSPQYPCIHKMIKPSKASSIAILIFELENGRQKDGHDFFTQFISANLGSLVSQGLLNGDQKIR